MQVSPSRTQGQGRTRFTSPETERAPLIWLFSPGRAGLTFNHNNSSVITVLVLNTAAVQPLFQVEIIIILHERCYKLTLLTLSV